MTRKELICRKINKQLILYSIFLFEHSVSVKCKQMETFNTYTLNSFSYVGIAGASEVML